MKLALFLPGYLDSPDYLHLRIFEERFQKLGFTTERLDFCHLWETGDVSNYTITNCLKQIEERVEYYKDQSPEEIILVGHSMGAFTAIISGSRIPSVTKIVALCPPPDRKGSVNKWKNKGARVSKRDVPNQPNVFREFAIPYSYVEDGLQYSAVDEVKTIHKPLIIFIALDDVVVPPALTEQIVKHANNPHVVRLPNMGHDFRRSAKECVLVANEMEKFVLLTS